MREILEIFAYVNGPCSLYRKYSFIIKHVIMCLSIVTFIQYYYIMFVQYMYVIVYVNNTIFIKIAILHY